LGTTRLEQKRYAEAEPLLLEVYSGMKLHENQNNAARNRLIGALERFVKLYEAWDKSEKATEWRKKLEEQKK
jgi:hypothetical protein